MAGEQHDDNQLIPGWAREREPKDEPRATNINLGLGKWIARASANSGPKIAPGTGRNQKVELAECPNLFGMARPKRSARPPRAYGRCSEAPARVAAAFGQPITITSSRNAVPNSGPKQRLLRDLLVILPALAAQTVSAVSSPSRCPSVSFAARRLACVRRVSSGSCNKHPSPAAPHNFGTSHPLAARGGGANAGAIYSCTYRTWMVARRLTNNVG
jgi:hypothetical protein